MQESCVDYVICVVPHETLGTKAGHCYAGCLYGIEKYRNLLRFRTGRCSEPLRRSRPVLPTAFAPSHLRPRTGRAVLRGR
jgi:hypothetical protein